MAFTDICLIVYAGDETQQNAKFSNTSNGAGFNSYYPTLPQITPRSPRHDHDGKPTPPMVTKTSPTPMSSARHPVNQNGSQSTKHDNILSNREHSDSKNSDKYNSPRTNNMQAEPSYNINTSSHVTKPPKDLRVSSHPLSNSENHADPPQHHLAGSPRRHPGSGPGDSGQEDFLRPLSATPPLVQNEKSKSDKPVRQARNESQHKNDVDSGIAGFSPDTYRDNEPLDR